MQPMTVKSLGEIVVVTPAQLHAKHALGMGWYEYQKLRLTNTHEGALAAFKQYWTGLGYGYRFN